MRHRTRLWARVERAEEQEQAKPAPGEAATPQQRLLRAAEAGQFEALVAKAQPAEPVAMVTPEEREAERRAAGTWPAADKPAPTPAPQPEPKPAEPERELTPNEQYIAEHCRWRKRGPSDYRKRMPYGRCLTEYDVLTGEIIGDGYDHSFDGEE